MAYTKFAHGRIGLWDYMTTTVWQDPRTTVWEVAVSDVPWRRFDAASSTDVPPPTWRVLAGGIAPSERTARNRAVRAVQAAAAECDE